ncbi:MAG: UDP-N-acetylmuramate--L-alanine ligase [Bacteroidales bacterium]
MNFESIHRIFFLGIGGIGMSALARFFHKQGKYIAGYDKTPTDLTLSLEKEGMYVHYSDDPALIPEDIDLVVFTPAIPKNNLELAYLKEKKIPFVKRAELLGIISEGIPTIAVAGTHGKTTITSMVAHIFKTAGIPVSAFMGGVSANYNTNLIADDWSQWMVAEADEFDRSFLHLKAEISLISSMDSDHTDIYSSENEMEAAFTQFAIQTKNSRNLIVKSSVAKKSLQIKALNPEVYGFAQTDDFSFQNIAIQNGKYKTELKHKEIHKEFFVSVNGRHNLENALAAVALSIKAGVSLDAIHQALESYKGVKRRFEIHVQTSEVVFIDDYAHHPEEIKACISSARELFPDKKITVMFQPHLYSRTQSFAAEFATSLSAADQVILMNIYPARELSIPGVDSQLILNQLNCSEKLLLSDEDILDFVDKNRFQVFITMGAGNIDRFVQPIKMILS